MRKRITSLLLTLVMLLSLVPAMGVTASAADDTFYEQVFIRRYRAFWDYLSSTDSRELVLGTDINYTLSSEDEEIEVRRSQRLDLNGHKIRIDATKRASFFSLITIFDGEFTLYDSKGGGEIAVEFAMDSKEHSIIKMFPNSGAYPKFTMNSGTLTRLNPIDTNAQGSNGCVSDSINNRVKDGEPRPQITINGGTINCPYSWDRSKPLPIYMSQFMPTALLLRESKLTVNGGTFNGMVWIEDLTQKKGETEPRVFLNGGVFNSSFVVQDVPKDVTRIIIDGARFNDGLYVGDSHSERTYNVGSKPALLIKSGVFDSPDQKPKLDIYAAIGENTENAMKCFPNSAIKMNGKIYTSENLGLLAKNDRYNYFNSNTPIEVIGRAWDLKEVLLDGSPIAVPNIRDGAAFGKAGSVPVYTVSTLGTHELVYRWYDLAKELRDAGWYYEIECGRGPGLVNIYNGSYTTANGICEWRYRLPNTPANIDAGQMAFTINLRHATDPTSIVYSNQYLLRYQVVQDSAQVITAGRLNMSGGDIIPSDAVSANQVTLGARENRFTVSAQTNWSLSGDTRSKTVTLKAANGYRFLSATDFSVEGANCVTAKSSSVSADGKTCKVRVEARVCRLLTHIAGMMENFYVGRTFGDVSISSGESNKYRFEVYAYAPEYLKLSPVAYDPNTVSAPSVSGTVKSYNPNNPVTVQLIEQGHTEAAYETIIDATTGNGQKEQNFSFPAVAAGTYDLVVTKPGHLSYTVKGIVVGDTPLDLKKHSNAAISTITLLCGDIDGNGFINSTDLGIILKGQNYGKSTATAGDKAADLDGNGFINSTDLGIVLQGQHYGKSAVSVSFAG